MMCPITSYHDAKYLENFNESFLRKQALLYKLRKSNDQAYHFCTPNFYPMDSFQDYLNTTKWPDGLMNKGDHCGPNQVMSK